MNATDFCPEHHLTKPAYTVRETQNILCIGRTKLYGLVKDGELTPHKLGRRSLFFANDIAALLNRIQSQ